MDKSHSTIRITREAHRNLRLIAAIMGKSIVAVMDELTYAKLAELNREGVSIGASTKGGARTPAFPAKPKAK